ncbi:ArsR/SmtB family transcription factor [Bifidobacterium xylocopae]|uniref:Transcriptional regulator n=1 Tax=Bifidobacterium xylocopae TaxID=2493119 RepID=A0A366KHC7_9BIFI|nr:metalloregulator ArsR/SmtB family transcription factor [Bifidobacterium xylocopae]RBQ00092.1 transcriptional regulator [Bifidobacterium xylocopae]
MTIEFRDGDARLVGALKALADESRLQMVRMLHKHGSEMNCGQIGEHLDLNKSTVSYHFRILREAGLTSTRKEGQNRFVSLNEDAFDSLLPHFLDSLDK